MRRARGRPLAAFAATLLLAASLLRCCAADCSFSLSLPAGGGTGGGDGVGEGWCAPYASATNAASGVLATCGGISVPQGASLTFGTCALPGAACTGSTELTLRDTTSGALLSYAAAVALNDSAALLSRGCILGASCSHAAWRNTALAAAAVAVEESCYGHTACAGVVAWRVDPDASLAPALAPTSTPALAFTATAKRAARLTGLAGAALGAASVTVYARVGVLPFATPGALANATGWAQLLYSGAWSSSGVTFTAPLTLAAGDVAALHVVSTTALSPLSCVHALGDTSAELLSDDVLSVSQAGALAGAFTGAAAAAATPLAACAWDGLALTYENATACAPPGPPPAPTIQTNTPSTLVASLDDLLRALATPAVRTIELNDHIELNGTQLVVALPVGGSSRRVVIEGTNACHRANAATRLCSISAGGLSRVFNVSEGVSLWLGHVQLRDGLAPPGGSGGCTLVSCANCSLVLEVVEMRNCSAPDAYGGALAVVGGATLRVVDMELYRNTAAVGGALYVASSVLQLANSRVHNNTARGDSQDPGVGIGALRGPAGGGAALFEVSGTITGCAFGDNAATTTDVVLLANPDLPQARGGGLFALYSHLVLSGTTLSGNAAAFGGGLYADESTLALGACAVVDNLATLGDGGGVFASDGGGLNLTDTLLSGNAAGGTTGGGLSAFNTSVEVYRSVITANTAPGGCGGGVGLFAGASLSLAAGTAVSTNTAHSGGGVCCIRCLNVSIADAFLWDNRADEGAGGALHGSSTPITVVNATIWGNSAPRGGALSAASSPLTITGSALHDNLAFTTHGGAVLHDASDDALQVRLCAACGVAFFQRLC
jgi:hypothetical protein